MKEIISNISNDAKQEIVVNPLNEHGLSSNDETSNIKQDLKKRLEIEDSESLNLDDNIEKMSEEELAKWQEADTESKHQESVKLHNTARELTKSNSKDDHEKSKNCLDRAIELRQGKFVSWLYHDRGIVNRLLGDYEGALADFSKEIENHNNAISHYEIAVTNQEMPKIDNLAVKNSFIKAANLEENNFGSKNAKLAIQSIYRREISTGMIDLGDILLNGVGKDQESYLNKVKQIKESYENLVKYDGIHTITINNKEHSFGDGKESFDAMLNIVEEVAIANNKGRQEQADNSFLFKLWMARRMIAPVVFIGGLIHGLLFNKAPRRDPKPEDFRNREGSDGYSFRTEMTAKGLVEIDFESLSLDIKESLSSILTLEESLKLFKNLVKSKDSQNFKQVLEEEISSLTLNDEEENRIREIIKEDLSLEGFVEYKVVKIVDQDPYKNLPKNVLYENCLIDPDIKHSTLDQEKFNDVIGIYENTLVESVEKSMKDMYEEVQKRTPIRGVSSVVESPSASAVSSNENIIEEIGR